MPWDEGIEECAECGLDLFEGEEVYEIGDGERYYCKDCLTEDELEKRTKCTCCNDELEIGEKIFKTIDENSIFCCYCVSLKTLEVDEPDWDSMPGGYDDI